MKWTLVVSLLLMIGAARAQMPCKVLDPDLQGGYTGECTNGMASGNGVASGRDRYEGEFRDGAAHGSGTYTWGQGTIWKGDVFVGRFWRGHHVQGKYTNHTGEIHEGTFVQSRSHGFGVMYIPPGSSRGPAGTFRGVFDGSELISPCEDRQACQSQLERQKTHERNVCLSVRLSALKVREDEKSIPDEGSGRLYLRARPVVGASVNSDAFASLPRRTQEQLAMQVAVRGELARINGEHRLPKILEQEFRRLATPSLISGQVDLQPVLRGWLDVCDQMEHVHSLRAD